MLVDLLLLAVVAVLTMAMAALGGHLAATKRWHKLFFWSTGLLSVFVLIYSGYRSEIASQERDASIMMQLAQIKNGEKNTEAAMSTLFSFFVNLSAVGRPVNQPTGSAPKSKRLAAPQVPGASTEGTNITIDSGPSTNSKYAFDTRFILEHS